MATVKQKLVAKKIVENGSSVRQAMLEAGYSRNTAVDPGKVTRSSGFKEVLEQMGISDEQLATVLKDGLGATKTIVMGKDSNEAFVDIQPDYAIRHKYLETGLRLKGHTQEQPSTNYLQIIQEQKNNYGI